MPGERGGLILEKVLVGSGWTGGGDGGLSGFVVLVGDGVSVSEGWFDSCAGFAFDGESF